MSLFFPGKREKKQEKEAKIKFLPTESQSKLHELLVQLFAGKICVYKIWKQSQRQKLT